MLKISRDTYISDGEIELKAICSQGPGGQNVNKVATAIQLFFDIRGSSLPEFYKERLLQKKDARVTLDGIVVIKADRFRSQEQNREDALDRLRKLIRNAIAVRKKRVPTKPTKASNQRRIEGKSRRGEIKSLRKPVSGE